MIVIAWRHSAKMDVDRLAAGRRDRRCSALSAIVRSLSNPNDVMNFGKRFAVDLPVRHRQRTRPGPRSGRPRYRAIKARPIFGFGADTFRLVFPTYKPVEYVTDAGYLSVADNVHNYPLQLAAGIGIPGVLLMYGIFGWAAVRSFATVFNKTDDTQPNPGRRVLGRLRGLPAPAHGRSVGHRQHVPAVDRDGGRAGADRLDRRGQGAQVGQRSPPAC